jgi:hypothetical protein
VDTGSVLRRVQVLVIVAAVLVSAGCSMAQRPLRQGFGGDAPTTTAPGVTTTSGAPARTTAAETKPDPASSPAQLTQKLASAVLPAQVLAEDGLEVQESAQPVVTAPDPLCGKASDVPGRALTRYRVITRSRSGATTLDQYVNVHPGARAQAAVEAARRAQTCAAVFTDLPRLSGVDDQFGWCETTSSGRGACTVLLAKNELSVSLRLDTISAQRAREVITRLATASAAELAKD